MQLVWTKGATVTVVEVIVTIAVEGSAEALRVGVVHAGHADRQAHPPVTDVGPNKGPGGKDQLREGESQPEARQHNLLMRQM